MASIDSLSIRISASTTDAQKKVDALVKSLDALVVAIDKLDVSKFEILSQTMNDLSQSFQGLKGAGVKQIEKAAKALKNIESQKESFEPIKKGAEEVSQATQKISENADKVKEGFSSIDSSSIDGMASSMQKASSTLDNTTYKMSAFKELLAKTKIIIPTEGLEKVDKQIEKLTEKVEDLKDKLNYRKENQAGYINSEEMEKDQKKIDGLITELDRLKLKKKELESDGGFRINGNGFASWIKESAQSTASLIGKLGTLGKKISGVVAKFLGIKNAAKAASKATQTFNDAAKKLGKSLTRITKMLKLMVTRMALRAIIKEVGNGFKSLALHSEEFDNAMSGLVNSSKKVGYAFAAMAGPLINALAPAIIYVLNLLTKLLNVLNQIFSAFSGKGTWNKVKDFGGKWSDGFSSANKSAKELKKTILGFDEINQLQDNNSNSGGGSSGDIEDMFDTSPIEDKWKNFANWLKSMWEKADFTDLGRLIGQKLLDALNKIPWNKIKAKAYKLGKSLATLINGFIETPTLARTMGKSIAELLNSAILFANGIVRNLHWDSLGKFIADLFNGFFENIDWYYIKDTVVTGFRGAAIAIQKSIETFDWDNISRTIINGLDVIAEAVKAFFENIDWRELGGNIGEQIEKVIRDTDWREIGQAIGDILQAAIDFTSSLISQLSWEDIKNAIKDLFAGIFDKVDTDVLADIIEGILATAFAIGVGKIALKAAQIAFEEKIKSLVTASAADSAVTEAAEAAGGSVGLSFIAGATAALAGGALGAAIIEAFDLKEGWAEAGTELAKEWYGLTPTEEQTQQVKDFVAVYEGFSGTLEALKNAAKDVLRFFGVDIPQSTYELKDELGNVTKTVDESGKTIIDFSKDTVEAVGNMSTSAIDFADQVESEVSSSTNAVISSVGNLEVEVKKDTDSINKSTNAINFQPLSDKATQMANTLTIEFESVDATVSNTELTMSGSMQTMTKDVASASDEIIKSTDKIKDGMSEDKWTFSGVWEGLKKTFEKAKEAIKGVWNSIADKLNGQHKIFGSTVDIDLPKFAAGGFPEDGLFMANHNEMVGKFSNGKTAVANNEQITAGIAQAVYSAMMSANGGGGSVPVYTTIQIGEEQIARAVTKGQRRMDRRYSPTMA